jgi:hypothetical protein
MIKLMLITNNISIAKEAVRCGVDRIFVDLEVLGKHERQGHRDTLISEHSINDVASLRSALPEAEILVRCNPVHAQSADEIDGAIEAGADLLMLPMFRRVEEVSNFSDLIGGRVPLVPLVETVSAVEVLKEVVGIPGVGEIYIGLNDLHMEMGLKFMFEPVCSGLVEEMAATLRQANMPFGFGGVARMGEGELPGCMVLGEHVRIGSSSVILSRTFFRQEMGADPEDTRCLFDIEVRKFREMELKLGQRTKEEAEADHVEVCELISRIAAGGVG